MVTNPLARSVPNKAPVVDGVGLFLRGHSQETPSPILSFLLFSLAASACPLLSFLISTASAARTPSRQNLSLRASLPSCIFQGQSPHITFQFFLKHSLESKREGLWKDFERVQSDLTPFGRKLIKAVRCIRLLVLLIIVVQWKKGKLNKMTLTHSCVHVCPSD